MGSQRIYTLPVGQTGWAVGGSFDTVFNWEYDDLRDRLITLYSKGKQKQCHVEVYSRFLQDMFEIAYPITQPLKEMLEGVIRDSRWDFTYLGMQILIEGLALAAFGLIRDFSKNPLASAINAYVMQDEARHVAFGRLSLKDYYPQLTQKERDEREEFVVEASFLMRDRFMAEEVWQKLGYPDADFEEYVKDAPIMVEF